MFRKKPQFIINPKTNRTIQIGGRIWYKLVKEGVLERGNYLPPSCAFKLKEDEYKNDQEKLQVLEKEKQRMIESSEVPDGTKAVIVNKDRIVVQKPRLTAQQTSKLTSNAALDIIDKIQNNEIEIPTDMSRDEARDYLQSLIFNEMIASKKKFKNTRLEPVRSARRKKPRKKVSFKPRYQTVRTSATVRKRKPEPVYQQEEWESDDSDCTEADDTEYEYVYE